MNVTQMAVEGRSAAKSVVSPGPAVWQIDPSHASAQFSVRHMMVSNVRGEFSRVTGSVRLDSNDVSRSSIEAVIDASSIQTREPARDQHLRSADFLDVERYPVITFTSRSVEGSAGAGFRVTGDLTIRGVTRLVVLDVEPLSPEIKDPYGNVRVGTSGATKIDRRDFGLTWNGVLETGGVLVGNEVKITLDVELIKAAGAAAESV